MNREIVIDPVTRIEGHANITIRLDDTGQVADAHFHVTQFRGFERIVQGRPVHEMPSIMARICGICPVSHLVASAKACDEILAVQPPPAGADLRRVMNLAQIVQSNALSFFHLSSPDLLFGFDADPAGRNLFGMVAAHPQLARDGIALRRFGQQVIERLGGKRIHPAWVVAGGVEPAARPPTARDAILASIPEALAATTRALDWYTGSVDAGPTRRAVRRVPLGVPRPGRPGRRARALRRAAARRRRGRPTGSPTTSIRGLRDLLRRGRRAVVLPEVGYWRAARLPGRRVPGRPAGPAQRRRPDGHAASRRGAGRVPGQTRTAPRPARSTTTTPG